MNCQRARDSFAELLDSRTAATAHLEARAHLVSCPECQREFSSLSQTLAALDSVRTPPPSPRLRENFYAMLAEEKRVAAATDTRAATPRPQTSVRWWFVLSPIAACALVVVGFIAGMRFAPVPPPQVVTVADPSTKRELQDLRAKVDSMGQVVGYALLQQQQRAGNDRLRGVMTSAALDNPNEKAIHDLITAVALDPSTNVRLRALDALYPHAGQEVVRAGVLASLRREENPLVQVAMIDFLAAAGDREARPALEKMSLSNTTDRSVRDAARRALTQL